MTRRVRRIDALSEDDLSICITARLGNHPSTG